MSEVVWMCPDCKRERYGDQKLVLKICYYCQIKMIGGYDNCMHSGYISEEKFIDIIEACLKKNGCDTWREVKPDNSRYRVDLIFYRKDFGYIGVEGKNIRTLGQGGVICDAVDQIECQYKNQTYFNGKIINKWCLLIPTETDEYHKREMNRVIVFLRHFLKKRYDILLLEYTPRNGGKISIDIQCKESIYIGNVFNKWGKYYE